MERIFFTSKRRNLKIHAQPDDSSCGPTCLHAIYRFYNDAIPLERVIREVKTLEGGGTLAVFLGCHALKRGYRATIYTLNLQVFDPTWFAKPVEYMVERLKLRSQSREDSRLSAAVEGYVEFIEKGGEIRFCDMSSRLIRKYLDKNIPVISGLSSTFLYRSMREEASSGIEDDVIGDPAGHFVVLVRYDRVKKRILLADPYEANPLHNEQYYYISSGRLINSILLGIVTYDSNLLIIEPGN
ncbi:MAG: peptidase-C39 like family protein [Spirochaetes bacterium]|nr:peptidase-C39 like family protein [Spirochaetota bacterium]